LEIHRYDHAARPGHTEAFADALAQMRKKKGDQPAFARLRLEPFLEGLSVQTMHVGPYAAEAPTIARLHQYIEEQGYVRAGKHHEVYLGEEVTE